MALWFVYCWVCGEVTSALHSYHIPCVNCLYSRSRNCEKRLFTSSRLSAYPSVCPHGTTRLPLDRFSWNLVYRQFFFFRKSVEKIQISLKSDSNTGTVRDDRYTFLIISRSVHLRMWNISDKSCGENQTHFVLGTFFVFRKSCRLWHNVEKSCRPGLATDDNMTHGNVKLDTLGYEHTLGICSTHCFSTVTMDARTLPRVTLNVHCLSWLPIRKSCTFIICPRGLTNSLNPQSSWLYVIKHHDSTGKRRHLHQILATLDFIFVLRRQLKMPFSCRFTCRLSAAFLLSPSFVRVFNMFRPSCVLLFGWCCESPRRLVTSTRFADFSEFIT